MIKVIFYTYNPVPRGTGFFYTPIRHEIFTGKTTIAEAFDVAVANGADPRDTIEYKYYESESTL